ncbi:MAG: flagellar basal body rod protein FlgB [Desulfobacteraceae bacterium]|nr:flagellar basal body rod protein FlgB [Desulfobacteraceae bacterium]
METNTLFDNTVHVAERALNLRSRRHELILSNIANADTPNYKAFDLMVEEALAKQAPQQNQVELRQTDPNHIPAGGIAWTENPVPQKIEISPQATLRGDGNTVDMDREMSSLAANQLKYRASSQILSKKFQSIHNAIQGSRR